MTKIEVLVLVAALALLAVCLLPALARTKPKVKRINCANNLKQVGLAFRLWMSNGDRYQMQEPATNAGTMEWVASGEVWPHFLVMSNELNTPKLLTCPVDTRQPALSWASLSNTTISYFVGLDADETLPNGLLSGDSNLEVDGRAVGAGLLSLWTNSVVGWTTNRHCRSGNVTFADGTVQQFTLGKLREALANASPATNRLAIP